MSDADPIWTLLVDRLNEAVDRATGPAPILREHSFADDLGISSMEMVAVVMDVEERTGISIDASDLKTLRTVGDADDLIRLKLSAARSDAGA